jgi:hypothetical protein
MAKRNLGLVFYGPSRSGYCIYYLPPGMSVDNRVMLTSEMPFVEAATMVHGLNCCLFGELSGHREIGDILHDYLIINGGEKYTLS